MDAFRLDGIVGHQLVLAVLALGEVGYVFELGELRGDVGQHEELGILRVAGKFVDTLVGKLHRAVFLIDYEIEGVGHHGHLAGVVLKVVSFCFKQALAHAFLTEEAYQRAVLRQALEGTEQQQVALFLHFLVGRGKLGLRFGEDRCDEALLGAHHFLHIRLVDVEKLVVALGHGA